MADVVLAALMISMDDLIRVSRPGLAVLFAMQTYRGDPALWDEVMRQSGLSEPLTALQQRIDQMCAGVRQIVIEEGESD